MKGVIIVNQQIGHNEYKVKRLKEEFSKKGIAFDCIKNNGTLAEIVNGNVTINLPKYDFVIYADKDIYLARLLEKAGYRLFNKADFIKTCDDKILTFIKCANLGIRMPDTFAGPLVYYECHDDNLEFLPKVVEKLGLPMVVKKVYGSLGEGVYLVKTLEELENLYKEICRNPILFQRYVSSSKGKSVRALIVDGKVFGAFIRENFTDFRSNFGENATGEKLLESSKYFKVAQDIADKLQIEYAGIDLLEDNDGEPILCEINSNAFFEEFEKITQLNAAEAIVNMIIRRVNNNE